MSFLAARPNPIQRRRAQHPHSPMFLRMLLRATLLGSVRARSALLAMVVASAVSTAMLTLYVDVQAKLAKEFRSYGANIVVVAKEGTSLRSNALAMAESALSPESLAVPFAYAVASTSGGQSVVVAGTDFQRVRKLDAWWSVTAWPAQSHDALVGIRAAAVVGSQPFALSFQGRTIQLNPTGVVRTGAAEDSRIYISLEDFQAWTGVQPSTIEIRASGSASQVNAIVQRLAQSLSGVEVRPVRQIVEAEARVLGKTRAALVASAALIILTAALCVLATLMGWVLDRRRDFAIMKALGASERLLNGFFAAAAATVAISGALLGFVIGIGIAAWIGRANFHAAVVPRIGVLPIVLAGSLVLALVASLLPLSVLRRLQPAMILRGE